MKIGAFTIVLTPLSETVVPSVATQVLPQAVRRRHRGRPSLPAKHLCTPPVPYLWGQSYNFAQSAASLPSSARPSYCPCWLLSPRAFSAHQFLRVALSAALLATCAY